MAQHTLTLTQTYGSGHEEYTCPICGFKTLLDWDTEKFSILVDSSFEVEHVARRAGYAFYIGDVGIVNGDDKKYLEVYIDFIESDSFRALLGD